MSKAAISRALWNEAAQKIYAASHIAVLTHFAPDGDAIGSLLGFTKAIASIGKAIIPYCQDPAPLRFSYLNDITSIRQEIATGFDLLVLLDANTTDRFGNVFPTQVIPNQVLVFDHHKQSGETLGLVEVIDPQASSTCEIVAKLLDHMQVKVDRDIATCLLTGLITDTGSFRNTATTSEALRIASTLVEAGAPISEISERTIDAWSLVDFKVLGLGLSKCRLEGRIIHTQLTIEDQKLLGVEDRSSNNKILVNTMIATSDADVAIVFVEKEGGVTSVSMRSKADLDISKVAVFFGGGGHKNAAGYTVSSPLKQTVHMTITKLRELKLGV